ncbi:MAG: winged helix-turn-helix domain-containing protein [Candidatus Hodarchaeales archaeon]
MDNDESTSSMQVVNEVVIKALNNKVRRKILQNLNEYGWAGYSELSEKLNIKAGSFYHHIRLLEESGLVKQRGEDKIYEITPTGAQATEFISRSFSPDEDEDTFSILLRRFDIISDKIEAFPAISILLLSVIFCLGIYILAVNQQVGLIGFFITQFDQTGNAILYSFFFTTIGLIVLYIYFTMVYGRLLTKKSFAGHLLLPQTFYVLIITVMSFFPILNQYNSLPSVIGITTTIIFQLVGISYYIHIFKKLKVRLLGRVIIILLIHQYYNLLVLFLFT